ncbi:DUF930 domain-containing protein [Rhizobium sp. FY34]|uniref:DUF930 domain-containing protein n=1 Tax=Rhizobium sp. FY34 TaxID=2562309 RepID=UPI00148500DF|nr:DUF930 domain-containing protein [Rhizobium sp. FY34]
MQDEPDRMARPEALEKAPEEQLSPRRHVRRVAAGIAVSITLHGLILAGFFVSLSLSPPEPPPEEVVSVELVPPPEPEPAPEPAPPAQDEQPAEAPPPPPPPPPPPAEQPKPPVQEEAVPLEILKPVFRFGEETRGTDKPQDGDGAQLSEPQTEPVQPDEANSAEELAAQPEEPTAEPLVSKQPKSEPLSTDNPLPGVAEAGSALPPMLATELASEVQTMRQETAEEAAVPVAKVVPIKRPEPPPASAGAAPPTLRPARRIYSQAATGSAEAMSAMAGLPAGMRAGLLCSTELREQLRRSSPGFEPEILPSYTLAPGTVTLDVGQGAFRAGGVWYNVGFACTVDEGATQVKSFSLAVGRPVPRSDWRARGFPQF